MKKMRSKKAWLTASLAMALTLLGAGAAAVKNVEASAEEIVTAETVALTMDKGAAVRIGAVDGNNGIRFALTMDKTEYGLLMDKVGTELDDLYSEISFGVIITKASYVSDTNELSVENLFDLDTADGVDNTKFEWKPEGADENWTVSEGKSLVVNQTFGYLGESEYYENEYVGFASLVQIQDYNLTEEFIGRGYMKYTTVDGVVNYRMANYYEDVRANNVRSMTYVAQKAIEDPKMADSVETLNSLYVSHPTVAQEKVSVTVKHHKLGVHGDEKSVQTEVLTDKTIGETVTATPLTEDGWIYDESKSTVSGAAYANNKTVLDLYYNQDPTTAYGAYHVGGQNPVEKTIALDEVVKGGIKGETVEVELALDLLEGTMPGIKVWLFVADLNAANAQITSPSSSYLPVADYYDAETGTYKFQVSFAWNSPNWDIGNVRIALQQGTYKLGVDVVSVKVLSDYDAKINRATSTTYELPEAITDMAQYGTADVTLQLTELIGDLTQIKVELLNANGEVIADNDGEYYTLADCATAEANTYKFSMMAFNTVSDYTITAIRLTVDTKSYVAGVYVKDIATTAKDYDFVIDKKSYYEYTLSEAVTGAVRYDTALVTVELTELVGDLTELHLQIKNNAGTVVAHNDNKYFTLADCETAEENTYAFALTFPWANGNWDITEIIFTVGDTTHVVGFNVKSVEVVPVEYDLKFTANAAHEQQTYQLETPIKAMKGDKIEIVFTMTNFYGTINGASTDIYFYLNDALGHLAVTPGWLELTDILVEGSTYKAVANVNASVEIYSIKVQVKYAQMSGLNFDSITLDAVDYDFTLNEETTITYTLPEAVSGMAQYGVADVTLQLVELSGDLTQVHVELLNANGDVIADNGGEYYTLADCATGEANEYMFKMISFAELTDYDIAAIRLTVDGSTYVVGGYYKEITASAKDYDFVINKTANYTYTLPTPVTGAVRYDTALVTVELTELVGDLTKLHLQIKNNVGTVVAHNDNKYFTLADCETAEENTYAFALTFPWANGNWDITEIIFTVGDTTHVVGFNVKSIEIVPVEYDVKLDTGAAHQTKTYTLPTPVSGAIRYDKLEVVFTLTTLSGTVNGSSTDIYFHIYNKDGVLVANSGWLELSNCLVEGETNQYSFTVTLTDTRNLTIASIAPQVKAAAKCAVDFDSITLIPTKYDAMITGNGWTNNAATAVLAEPITGGSKGGSFTVTFTVNVISGSITKMYYELQYAKGTTVQSLYNSSWDTTVTQTGTYTYTKTFANWGYTNPTDIYQVLINLYGDGAYQVGIIIDSITIG